MTKKLKLLVMFTDEGRFGRITIPATCWAPPGIRPTAPKQAIREYTYAYAAIAPADGAMDSLILPDMYASTLQIFLDVLSNRHPNRLILLIADGAPSHRAGKEKLTIPNNIRIVEQPPYSPEVNPVEHLWDEMREKFFCNRVFRDMDAVEARMVEALLFYEGHPQLLHSITGFPWIKEGLLSITYTNLQFKSY